MSLKVEFVERATQPGAKLAPLCREFGISRPTGLKWVRRFKAEGPDGLEERSRRPASSPLSSAEEIVMAVLEQRDRHPRWGAKKLRVLLHKRYADAAPSVATIARILKRAGLIRARRRPTVLSVVEQAPHSLAKSPNDVWTIDFKGWWRTLDGSRCAPLTIRDACSRYVLSIVVLDAMTGEHVRAELERLFKKHGLPRAIQCDNGTPFVATRARGGFTTLSVWLASLGIRIVRSRLGCPQDNGGHERMHRDVAEDVERWPSDDLRAQQHRLDRWKQEFNHVRPHEALGGKTPAEIYKPSDRKLHRPRPFAYPPSFLVRRVDLSGHICMHGVQSHMGMAFRGHDIGLEPQSGLKMRVWLRDVDRGCIEALPEWFDQAAAVPPSQRRREKKRNHDAAA